MNNATDLASIISNATTRIRSVSSNNEYVIGQEVNTAIELLGGQASTEFLVTEQLASLVPYGARRLRMFRYNYLNALLVESVALSLVAPLATNPWADAITIATGVETVVASRPGASVTTAVAPLANRLGVSSSYLIQFWRVKQVLDLCGSELLKIVPDRIPMSVLPLLAPLMLDRSPVAAQAMITKAARIIIARKLQGKKIVALVASMHTDEGGKPPASPAVKPKWHRPPSCPVASEIVLIAA
jgi:hypothetical protein